MPEETLPIKRIEAREIDLLVILGGRWGARDENERLLAERRLARRAAESGTPVLGLCLGAQMLAVEFEGDIVSRGAPEFGWTAIELLDDTLAAAFREPCPFLLAWHNDAIVLPPQAALLARSETCGVQAFRIPAPAPVIGLQFHLEADAEKIALFRRAGKRDGARVAEEAAAIEGQRMALFALLDDMLRDRAANGAQA